MTGADPTVVYEAFLASKRIVAPSCGVEVPPDDINPILFPFQRDLVRWALRKGRAAIFAQTGLGKTMMQLEFLRLTGERGLILAPLAVTHQTIREAERLGIELVYAHDQTEAGKWTITNYERLGKFDPSEFGTVVLDESGIIKSFDGKTKTALIKAFQGTRWRLCCTATPAPNDTAELGNHAEFLGLMTRAEMLATFFVHDNRQWLLKGHARRPFFRWLASWGMTVRKPSDLGYEDGSFTLPPLDIREISVPTEWAPDGQLFPAGLRGITERIEVRRASLERRVAAAVNLVEAEPGEQWLLWCGLNEESDALSKALPGSVVVQGSDDPDWKAEQMLGFAAGETRVLISKVRICGFGMNFQSCARMAFVGIGDSFEQYYQAIRRCWRFGQTRKVKAFIVVSDAEREVYRNVLRKETEAAEVASELIANVAEYERVELRPESGDDAYQGQQEVRIPTWLA